MSITKKALLTSTFTTLLLFWLVPVGITSNKWVYVATDSRGYKFYYDNSTIKKVGDKITYDQMITFSAPQYGMTGGTSQLKASCKNRVAIEGKYAAIANGQSRPYKMNEEFTRMYLNENSELGKVLNAVCKFRK